MKKLLALMLAFTMLFSFAGCGVAKSDSEAIKDAGKIVIGITEYAPMNYKDGDTGEWTGFDTEFAQLFAQKLGVEVEFVEIIWDAKFEELEEGNIDCIWNGMTITEQAKQNASISKAYVRNSQVLVMKADRIKDYNDGYDIKDLKFAVEKGSAAVECIERDGYKNVTQVESQAIAVEKVHQGTADAAVVDSTMANAMTGDGTAYPDLAKGFDFSAEVYGVAFRQNSDLTDMLNDFMEEIWDEELIDLANKYNLTLV